MEKILKKLEGRIDELKQEEVTGIIHTCDFLSEDTLRARKELREKLEAKRDKLLGGTTEVCCVSDGPTPTRVELMDAWGHLSACMLIITWACMSIVCRYEGAPAAVCILGTGFTVVAAWLPSLAAMGLYNLFDRFLRKRHPLYQAPRMLMRCHLREIKERLNHLSKPGEFAKDISLTLCAMIMLGNIASFICHPDFSYMAIFFGFLLSAGGLLAFGAILLADLVAVVFQRCKLWVSISYDLRQVF